jgi:hypothetical protein
MKTANLCRLACGVAAAMVVMLWCSTGAAQHLLHPGHHHHPAVVRPPVVIRPYSVVQPAIYTQPVVVYSTPSVNPLPAPISVTIVNPLSTGATLNYTISGTRYTLAAGNQQAMTFGGPRTLEFDRGGGYGIARTTLRSGLYTFVATDRGWTLRWQP